MDEEDRKSGWRGDGSDGARFGGVKPIVDRFPDPVFVTDSSGYVSYANRAFTDRLGYDASDGELHVSEFLADDDVEVVLDVLRELVAADSDASRRVEVEATSADGRTLVLDGSVSLLPCEDDFAGICAVLRDVTAQRRRLEVFSVMDRTLRHNLRNTVSIINVSVAILERELEGDHDEVLDRIYDSANELQNLGDRLRTIRNAIEESFEYDDTVPIVRLVESSVDAVDTSAADVTTNVAVQEDLLVPHAVEQAVTNLVENAVVHNDAEQPDVDVWATHAPRDGWIDVHVQDNGPGIPDIERDIVLGETTADQLQHASGLGLWISRWIVEVFGGELHIEDRTDEETRSHDDGDRGSVVTLRFPIAETTG